MEYISAEEFLKQPKEVQEVFLDWWKPSLGDLYTCDNNGILKFINEDIESELKEDKDFLKYTIHCFNSKTDKIIPLLAEGQIRKFIEDKTGDIIIFNYDDLGVNHNWYCNMSCEAYKSIGNKDLGTDLFQAYWKVACEIAKSEATI